MPSFKLAAYNPQSRKFTEATTLVWILEGVTRAVRAPLPFTVSTLATADTIPGQNTRPNAMRSLHYCGNSGKSRLICNAILHGDIIHMSVLRFFRPYSRFFFHRLLVWSGTHLLTDQWSLTVRSGAVVRCLFVVEHKRILQSSLGGCKSCWSSCWGCQG